MMTCYHPQSGLLSYSRRPFRTRGRLAWHMDFDSQRRMNCCTDPNKSEKPISHLEKCAHSRALLLGL